MGVHVLNNPAVEFSTGYPAKFFCRLDFTFDFPFPAVLQLA